MKTAMMPITPQFGGGDDSGNSAAVVSAVDAYATRVMETMSPPDAFVDTSLGPYITSLLRCAEINDKEEVTSLPEFDSLLELLEDQGSMEKEVATSALKTIANAVCTGVVPHEPSNARGHLPQGLYAGSGLDTFQTLQTTLPDAMGQSNEDGGVERALTDPYTPNSAGGPSPLKPDNLIPVDLLGALDDPSPHFSRYRQPQIIHGQPKVEEEVSKDNEAFPPLGASSVSAPSKKIGRGKKGAKAHSDKELAAALFRPARPRQNSIEAEESPQLKPAVPAANRAANLSNNMYFQQQWDSCVEILLSMNMELSEEAAAEAGLMANTDFNIAQYIVDAAMTAPPVCRHMLHDGCYRSDCQFSHDVEGHTCLFWLRGRCGKGTSCKFLHGFSEKLMDGIQMNDFAPAPSGMSASIPIAPAPPNGGFSTNQYSSSFQALSAPISDGAHGFSGYETQLGSSWQSPCLSESYLSGSSKPSSSFSFANIATRGYDQAQFSLTAPESSDSSLSASIPTVRIPQDLWNPHENRDASVFHIADPMERYQKVSCGVTRRDVVDLHFQSTKTFQVVLDSVLPGKLSELGEVWVVTGTGHHVGSKTHQKGGGALERAVMHWLGMEGYNFSKGRDRNGVGGALLVKR